MTPVYVVLVNTNGLKDTLECLESLVRSDYTALRIMVVDNGSTDVSLTAIPEWAAGTRAAPIREGSQLAHVTTPPAPKPIGLTCSTRAELDGGKTLSWDGAPIALVANGANLGFGGANNVAFRYVSRVDPDAYLLMLNNDTVIAPNAVSALVRCAERQTNVGGVGAKLLRYHAPEFVETLGGATVNQWTGFIRLIGAGAARRTAPTGAEMDFISGCCTLITPTALRVLGGIDERFFVYSEDADWGVRAREAGLSLVYCADAEVWHKGGATTVQRSTFHDYHTVKSLLHFVHKHRPIAVPVAMINVGGRMAMPRVLRGEWRRTAAMLRASRDFVRDALAARSRSTEPQNGSGRG